MTMPRPHHNHHNHQKHHKRHKPSHASVPSVLCDLCRVVHNTKKAATTALVVATRAAVDRCSSPHHQSYDRKGKAKVGWSEERRPTGTEHSTSRIAAGTPAGSRAAGGGSHGRLRGRLGPSPRGAVAGWWRRRRRHHPQVAPDGCLASAAKRRRERRLCAQQDTLAAHHRNGSGSGHSPQRVNK